MSAKIKEMIKLTKKNIKLKESIKNVDVKLIELANLKIIEIPDELYTRQAETVNFGRIRGLRQQATTFSSITWNEFLNIEQEEDLKYPISDIEANKEAIKQYLKELNKKELKLCVSNKSIEGLIDREYQKSKAKVLDDITANSRLLNDMMEEISEDEFEEFNDLTEELIELSDKFVNMWDD